MSNYKGYEMKALDKWYENKKSFPCECLCKFKPNDEKYEVATIVKFFPNNGWYEFVGDNKNTYSIAIPIAELEALQQPKSCEGCVYDDGIFCIVACSRRFDHDAYTKKEQ